MSFIELETRRRFDSMASSLDSYPGQRPARRMTSLRQSSLVDKQYSASGFQANHFHIAVNEKNKTLDDVSQISVDGALHHGSGWGTRHILVVLSMLINLVSYVMRTNINLAIIAMVAPKNSSAAENINNACPQTESYLSQNLNLTTNLSSFSIPISAASSQHLLYRVNPNPQNNETIIEDIIDTFYFDWSESMQGNIIGAFYYGYIITNVYGGQLADIVGTRLLLSISIGLSSMMTVLIPLSANLSVYLLIFVRAVMGFSQGVITSALYTLLPYWIPQNEQGVAFSLISASGQLGAVISMPLCAFLIKYGPGGWISVFYVSGFLGFALLLPWIFFVRNSPEEHPRISEAELEYIQLNAVSHCSTRDGEEPVKKAPVPWRSIVTSFKVLMVSITRFCTSWGNLFLISKLPTYLNSILHLPLDYNSYVNSSIYISLVLSLFFWGYISDYLQTRNILNRTLSRRLFQSIGMLGGATFLGIVPLFGCNIWAVIILLNLSMLMIGLTAGGEGLISVDIAPDFSGSVYGFTNAFASAPGVLAPLVVGVMLDRSASEHKKAWNILFWIGAGVYAFGALLFSCFVNTRPEPWGISQTCRGQNGNAKTKDSEDKNNNKNQMKSNKNSKV